MGQPVTRVSQAVTEFVATQPAAAAAVVVVAAVLGGVLIYWWFRTTRGEQFVELLADRDAVVVLMHPNPDPDAMATATAISALGEQFDTEVTVQYPGQIRHQENRAFRTVLDLSLDNIEHVTELAAEDVILVDHNTPRGFDGCEGVLPTAVVDHHPVQTPVSRSLIFRLPTAVVDHHPGDGEGELFTDVRTDYGACASIVAEYFEDIGAVPVPADEHASEAESDLVLPSLAATGLLYGILADTRHLTVGAATEDFEAASYLYAGVDQDKLDRIANPEVDAEVLEVKARAIAGRQVQGSFAVSDVGTVNNADAIPQAADEIIRLEGVTAVVVCGERNGTVHLSGRSRDDRVHMGRVLEHATADMADAEAGGHARMGGGQISPQPQLSDGGEQLTQSEPVVNRDALIDRIFASLSGDI